MATGRAADRFFDSHFDVGWILQTDGGVGMLMTLARLATSSRQAFPPSAQVMLPFGALQLLP